MDELSHLLGRHLCFLNWRDSTHPEAGGAEVYAEELARRFVASGVRVTLVTSAHGTAPAHELKDGVEIVRRGGTFSVYAHAAAHLRRLRGRYDAVVDFQNGIPFFSPLFAGHDMPVVLVVHHVHQDQFGHRFPWPLSGIGRWLEGGASRRAYNYRPIVTVSPSTRTEVRLRLGLRGPIHVVPNGVDATPRTQERSGSPTITVVTRLAPHKRLHLLVAAIAKLRSRWPDLHLHLAGRGPALETIQRAIDAFDVQDHVSLHGFVTDEERTRLLSKAWLTALPSEAEGWGLTILEANSLGVPAVGLRVPGVRDAIIDGETGWLANDPAAFPEVVDQALMALAEPAAAMAWADRCRAWANRFSWDNSAEAFARVLAGELRGLRGIPRQPRLHRDLAVKVSFRVDDESEIGDLIEGLERDLRTTDLVAVRDKRVTLLLHGADEVLATAILRRSGITSPLQFALVQPYERLTGLRDTS